MTVGAHQLLRLFTFRVADGSLFGNRLLRLAYDGLGAAGAEPLGALVSVALFVLALRATARLRLICLFLLTSSGLLLLVAVALRPSWFDWPGVGYTAMEGHLDLFNGRYTGVPALCLPHYGGHRRGKLEQAPQSVVAGASVGMVREKQTRELLANLPVNLYRPALSDWRP